MKTLQMNMSHDGRWVYPTIWKQRYPWLVLGFTTRNYGCSKEVFATFNLGLHVGDQLDDVLENRKGLLDSVHFREEDWVSANQIHGDHVYEVNQMDRGKGFASLDSSVGEADALFTKEKGIFLASFYADCVPIYVVDVRQHIVGIAHAGWKGTRLKIAPKLVQAYQKTYQSKLADIHIFIGPAIGGCCYEVVEPIIQHFHTEKLSTSCFQVKKDGKYMLDLKRINYEFLLEAGILADHIEVSTMCTSCLPDLFYSYRRDQGRTGRMLAFIALEEEKKL